MITDDIVFFCHLRQDQHVIFIKGNWNSGFLQWPSFNNIPSIPPHQRNKTTHQIQHSISSIRIKSSSWQQISRFTVVFGEKIPNQIVLKYTSYKRKMNVLHTMVFLGLSSVWILSVVKYMVSWKHEMKKTGQLYSLYNNHKALVNPRILLIPNKPCKPWNDYFHHFILFHCCYS